MALTMAELGAFAEGMGKPSNWAEWYAATQKGEFQSGQRVLPRRGETIMRLEPAETTAWRRAMAAERAAGVRGPARASRSPGQFKQRMAAQQRQQQRRSSRADAEWRQRRAQRRQRHREKQEARRSARAERQASQRERSSRAKSRARARAAAKRKAAHEAYLKQKRSTHEGYAPRTAFPSTMVSVARYTPARGPASASSAGLDPLLALQQKNAALFKARMGTGGSLGPGGGFSVGMHGLSGLG